MKHSITRKITIIIISLVAGTVILCWLLNATLLEGYYIGSKQESLDNVFWMIRQEEEKDTLYSETSNIELEKVCAKGNITMMIMDSGRRVLFLVGSNEETYKHQFMEILFAAGDVETEVLKQEEDYTVGRYKDSRLNTEYLILWGFLEDGNLILMRTALESIRESVMISNRFLTYLGIIPHTVNILIDISMFDYCSFPARQGKNLFFPVQGTENFAHLGSWHICCTHPKAPFLFPFPTSS